MDSTESDSIQINFSNDSHPPPPPPSIAMSATILSLKVKFPDVKQISTDILDSWMKSKYNSEGNNAAAKDSPNGSTTQRPKLNGKLVIVDARSEEEYSVSHLPNSYRVDFKISNISSFINAVPDLENKGPKTIVCYCSLGYRSSVIVQKLEEFYRKNESFPNSSQIKVFNLEGSIFKWANENRAMINLKNEPTIYAHPFNNIWGKLLQPGLRKNTS